MKKKTDILNSSPFKAMTFLLWPLLICGIFQQLYTTVDGIIVGKSLGSYAHAVIGGSPSNMINIYNNLSSGLISGALVVVAQAHGANDNRKKASTVRSSLLLILMLSVIIMILYTFFGEFFLRFLKVPEELMNDSLAYLRTYLWGFIPYSVTMLLINLQRGMGETKRPNYILVFNYIMYIVFDYLFVVVCKLGLIGVSCSYIATYTLSMVIMLLPTIKDFHLLEHKQPLDWKTIADIVKIGLPAAITSVFFAISTTLMITCMNRLGGDVVAAYSVANKIGGIMWIMMTAVTTATVTMVATNYGAGKMERIAPSLRAAMVIAMGSTALLWVVCFFWDDPLLAMFSNDPDILEQGKGILFFLTTTYFLYPPLDIYGGALKGAGHAMTATWITIICVGGFRFAWLLGFEHLLTDVYMVLIAYPGAWFLNSLVSYVVFQLKKKEYLKQVPAENDNQAA